MIEDFIKAHKEYEEFLSEEISRYASICIVHPAMGTSQETFEKGEKLRANLIKLEKEYANTTIKNSNSQS